jgi:hypothetical protein
LDRVGNLPCRSEPGNPYPQMMHEYVKTVSDLVAMVFYTITLNFQKTTRDDDLGGFYSFMRFTNILKYVLLSYSSRGAQMMVLEIWMHIDSALCSIFTGLPENRVNIPCDFIHVKYQQAIRHKMQMWIGPLLWHGSILKACMEWSSCKLGATVLKINKEQKLTLILLYFPLRRDEVKKGEASKKSIWYHTRRFIDLWNNI